MTDVLNRSGARDGDETREAGPKPVALSALIGAGASLLTGILACAAVAVTGWLAASLGGASGAVRAGVLTWLVAHKAPVQIDNGNFSLAPLGLTLVVLVSLYRSGRFTARVSAADLTGDLVRACCVLAVGYGAGAALAAVLVSGDGVRVAPVAAFVAAGSLALVAGTAGVLVESGAAEDIAVAFLAGPGFQVGTGTTVTPTGVELGNLPALPLLAALPDDGATPSYLLVLTAVVPLLTGVAGGLVVARRVRRATRRGTPAGWQGVVLRAALAGVLAGALLLILMLFAGGSAGPGRMADVGIPGAVQAAGTFAAGAVLGAVATALAASRVRRREPAG